MISFNEDPVVTDALQHWRGREVWPTEFSSRELSGFSRQLHERVITSARTTSAEYLQEVSDVVDDMLAGRINLATGRLRLMRKAAELGYDPEIGFPQDMANVPPAERGSLQDISSEQRINLMLRTLVAQARNFGRAMAGNTGMALFLFPAWELVRLGWRHTPRGTPDSHTAGWDLRWSVAGTAVDWEGAVQTRRIARKDSPIWQALGDGRVSTYTDTLGKPYPPFAFNSGMDWRAVPRRECRDLGLIDETSSPLPMEATLAPGEPEIQQVSGRLRAELKAELLRELREESAALAAEIEAETVGKVAA